MLLLLFLAGILFSPVPQSGTGQEVLPCADVAKAADLARMRIYEEWQTGHLSNGALRALSTTSREAWTCYLSHAPYKAGGYLRQDLYALRYLNAYHDLLQTTEAYRERASSNIGRGTLSYLFKQRGYVFAQLAQPLKSMRAYSRALDYAEGLNLLLRAELFMDAAVARENFNDFEGSLALYERAEILLARAVKEDPDTYRRPLADLLLRKADLQNDNIDRNASDRGDAFEEPLQSARRSEAIYNQLGLTHLAGMSLAEQTEAYLFSGRVKEALGSARRALQLSETAQHEPLHIAARQKLALVLLEMGRLPEAEEYMLQALRWTKDIGRYNYRNAIASKLGFIYEEQGQPRKAEHWYRRSIAAREQYRASLGLSHWSLATFSASMPAYRGLIRVLLDVERVEEAFQMLNLSRARYLYDLQRHAHSLGQRSAEVRLEADSLVRRLAELRSENLPADRSPEIDRAANELALLLDMPASPPTVFLPAIRNQLQKDNRVLVSYLIDSDKNASESYAFLLTHDALRAAPLDVSADTIQTLLNAVSPLFEGSDAPLEVDATRFDLVPLHRLYNLLFAPLEPYIPAGADITVIPDGPLHRLPFAMLVRAPVDSYAYKNADYLLRHHAISIEASAAHVALRREVIQPFAYDVVALGKSNFTPERLENSAGPQFPEPEISYSFRSSPFFDLPAVTDELYSLKSNFRDVLISVNEQATESFLYENMNRGRILHIASHAVANHQSPMQSTIILSPDSSNDGLVHLYELQGRTLNTPLVVLSSCNTARGKILAGEGVVGLHYGFRALGAQSLLATRWPVDDRAFATLISHFYSELASGVGKDEALRRAQLQYLESAPPSALSPFFWAAPMLYGNASSLNIRQASLFPLWGYGAGAIAVVVIALLVLFRIRATRSTV